MADAVSVPLWFSVLTFVAGILSSQLTELVKTKRERQARVEERRSVNSDRRNQNQRENLLALQEEVLTMNAVTSRAILAHIASLVRGTMNMPTSSTSEAIADASGKTAVRAVRIHDEQVSIFLLQLKNEQFKALYATSLKECNEAYYRCSNEFTNLNTRIGLVLKELERIDIQEESKRS